MRSPQFGDPKMIVMGFSHLVLPTFLPDSKRRISRETLFRNQSAAFFEKTSNSAQVGGGAQLVKLGLLNSKIIPFYGIIIKMSNILNMQYPNIFQTLLCSSFGVQFLTQCVYAIQTNFGTDLTFKDVHMTLVFLVFFYLFIVIFKNFKISSSFYLKLTWHEEDLL